MTIEPTMFGEVVREGPEICCWHAHGDASFAVGDASVVVDGASVAVGGASVTACRVAFHSLLCFHDCLCVFRCDSM